MTEVTLGREGIARHCNIVTPDGVLFKVFKTLAGDGFQTLQTGESCYYCASRPAGPSPMLPEKKRGKIMLEKQIERKLVNTVKAAGGLCPKFVSPGMDGMPDRLILMPGGRLAFVELKAPGKKPRPLQLHRHDQLRDLGFEVFVLDRQEDIPFLMAVFDILTEPSSI